MKYLNGVVSLCKGQILHGGDSNEPNSKDKKKIRSDFTEEN